MVFKVQIVGSLWELCLDDNLYLIKWDESGEIHGRNQHPVPQSSDFHGVDSVTSLTFLQLQLMTGMKCVLVYKDIVIVRVRVTNNT